MSTQQGQTVLITGASSGIGKATALYLAERGYDVVGTSRSMARLADLEAEASALGLSVSGVELDINSDDAATKVMAGIIDERGAIDVLVNNAGYGLWGPRRAPERGRDESPVRDQLLRGLASDQSRGARHGKTRFGQDYKHELGRGEAGDALQRRLRRQQVRPGGDERGAEGGAAPLRRIRLRSRARPCFGPSFRRTRLWGRVSTRPPMPATTLRTSMRTGPSMAGTGGSYPIPPGWRGSSTRSSAPGGPRFATR